MSFGAKILATLRALGLFGGVWAILACVAWGAGVLPAFGGASIGDAGSRPGENAEGNTDDESGSEESRDPSENQASENDTEVADQGDTENVLPAPVPVPVPGAGAGAGAGAVPGAGAGAGAVAVEGEAANTGGLPLASPFATSVALRVCEDPLAPVAITVGQLLGDDATELIIACGNEVNVLARAGSGVMRVAQVRDASSTPARAARVALADLGGDGRSDLLVGFIGSAESASASRLVVVASDERGGLFGPQMLAPISALSMAGAELDGRPGTDLVALHQADGFGRRPSEAWVIAGGPSPVRTHRQILHAGGRSLVVLDLDGDSNKDVLAADATGLFRYLGDGAGRLGTGEVFAEDVATHLAARSREDERQIAWSVRTALVLRDGDAEVREELGEEVRGLVFDQGAGLLVLLAQSWLRYEPSGGTLGDARRTPLPARLDALKLFVWGDEVVILARSEAAVELLRLPLEGGGEVDESMTAAPLIDAPLSLRVDVQ